MLKISKKFHTFYILRYAQVRYMKSSEHQNIQKQTNTFKISLLFKKLQTSRESDSENSWD